MNCTTRGLFKNSYCPNNWPSCISSAVATTSCLSSGRAHALSPPTTPPLPLHRRSPNSQFVSCRICSGSAATPASPPPIFFQEQVGCWLSLASVLFGPNKLSCHGWSPQIYLSGAFYKTPKYNWCCAFHQIFPGNPVPLHNPWGLHSWQEEPDWWDLPKVSNQQDFECSKRGLWK